MSGGSAPQAFRVIASAVPIISPLVDDGYQAFVSELRKSMDEVEFDTTWAAGVQNHHSFTKALPPEVAVYPAVEVLLMTTVYTASRVYAATVAVRTADSHCH
jgi:hypothetical protein